MMFYLHILIINLVCLGMAACGSLWPKADRSPGPGQFSAMATLYTTENTSMEGGPLDRCGKRLGTLEQYMQGKADYVSIAMDKNAFPYGTILRISELEKVLGKSIVFKVVDTGSAFRGKGTARIDICVGDSQGDISSKAYGWISQKTFQLTILARGESYACK